MPERTSSTNHSQAAPAADFLTSELRLAFVHIITVTSIKYI